MFHHIGVISGKSSVLYFVTYSNVHKKYDMFLAVDFLISNSVRNRKRGISNNTVTRPAALRKQQ